MKTYFKAVSMNAVMIVGLITVFAMALLTGCTKQEKDGVERGCALSIGGPTPITVDPNGIIPNERVFSRGDRREGVAVNLNFTGDVADLGGVKGGNDQTVTTGENGRVTVPIVVTRGNRGDSLNVGATSAGCADSARTFIVRA